MKMVSHTSFLTQFLTNIVVVSDGALDVASEMAYGDHHKRFVAITLSIYSEELWGLCGSESTCTLPQ